MVMHARKFPRLNDGYYDRNPAHPLEDKHPSKSPGSGFPERYSERKRPSPGSGRVLEDTHRPSPRSHAKQERYDKAKGVSSSLGDRRANHHASDRHYNDKGSKEAREAKDHRAEIQRSALRVCADWSEHISSSGKKYYYNCRTEVSQWEIPKEWDDNASKVVNDPNRARDKNGRSSSSSKYEDRQRHSSSGSGAVRSSQQPSSSSSSSSQQQARPLHYSHSLPDHRHSPYHVNATQRPMAGQDVPALSRTMSEGHKSRGRSSEESWGQGGYVSTHGSRAHHNSAVHNGARAADNSRHEDVRQCDDMDISPGSTPTHSRGGSRPASCMGTPLGGSTSTPGSTVPTSTVTSAGMTSTVLGAVAALPRLLTIGLSENSAPAPAPKVDNNDLTQQAIETLQKLQQALLVQQLQQQQTATPPSTAVVTQTSFNSTPHTAQHHTTHGSVTPTYTQHHMNNQDVGGTPSPKSELMSPPLEGMHPSPQTHGNAMSRSHTSEDESGRDSPRSDRSNRPNTANSTLTSKQGNPGSSPAAASSSQNVTLGSSALVGATRPQDGLQMAPSLAQYYKEDLVTHVPCCCPDSVERQLEQACSMSEEAHIIGSMHCSQVSMQLKKARSLVRIAEIQSTVQEQRVLFLRQQIKDLENMKSQNSFMPFSGT